MNNFVPDQSEAKQVPYFEDVSRSEGWAGYSTTKSVDRLKSEITEAVSTLGGFVSGFRQGTFIIDGKERQGFQVYYSLQNGDSIVPSRIDIASLPVKDKWNTQKKDKSMRMSLYILRDFFSNMFLIQHLLPGYAPLMPFVIADNQGNTVSQLWAETSTMSKLLPPPESDFIEAEEV